MDLSYAQRLEDYHLACAFGDQATGFYVDVGAGHPVGVPVDRAAESFQQYESELRTDYPTQPPSAAGYEAWQAERERTSSLP